jgi:hypothetical protein
MIRQGLNLAGNIGNIVSSRNQPSFNQLGAEDRAYNERMWERQLQASRPNQTSAWGSETWATDPTTGQMTRTQTLDPAEQRLLDIQRQNRQGLGERAGRMGQAIPDFVDWEKIDPNLRFLNTLRGGSAGGGQLGGK